jgi:hypothetical protein
MLPREQVASGAAVVVAMAAVAGTVVVMVVAVVGAMVAEVGTVVEVVGAMATGVVVAAMMVELQVEAILLLEELTTSAAALVVRVGLALPVALLVVMSSLPASAATRTTRSWRTCSRMTTSLTTTPTKGPSKLLPPSYPSLSGKKMR